MSVWVVKGRFAKRAGVEVREEDMEVDLSVDEFFECPRSLFSLFSCCKLRSLFGEH